MLFREVFSCMQSNIFIFLFLSFFFNFFFPEIYYVPGSFQAFKKAWEVACSSNGAVLVVAQKNYRLKPIRFSGPCKSDITMQVIKLVIVDKKKWGTSSSIYVSNKY
jgi:hypothetical protein